MPTAQTRRIKRIAPLPLGKILAILYAGLSLFLVPLYLFALNAMAEDERDGIFAMGIGFAFLIPVIYAVLGFVLGALGALCYNIVAKWVGGIEFEIEES